MPLNATPANTVSVNTRLQLRKPEIPVTIEEQIGAAFDMENVVESIRNRVNDPDMDTFAREGFNPLEHLRPGEEVIAGEFAGARSPEEMQLVRDRASRENAARRMLGEGPLNSFLASAVAVMADPTSYLGGIAGITARGGRLARIGTAGAVTAGETALAEGALQLTQDTRTATESMVAVLMGGAFGMGVAGAGVLNSMRANRAYERATDDMTDLVRDQFPQETFGSDFVPRQPEGTVGAASARPDPETTRLVGSGRVAEALAKIPVIRAPSLELSTSPLNTSREFGRLLVDTGLVSKGDVQFAARQVPVETRIRRYDAVRASLANNLDHSYRQYMRREGQMRFMPTRRGVLTRDQFYEQIGMAMRRGDASSDPLIEAAAKDLRSKVYEPLKNEAVARGLLPEDVDPATALSYFTRVYKRDVINAYRPQVRAQIARWLDESQGSTTDRLSPAELSDAADNIIDSILGTPEGRVPFLNIPVARGPLKERTFMIPDAMLEQIPGVPGGILENNAMAVTSRYVASMSADIELARAFNTDNLSEIGPDMARQIREEASARANDIKDPKKRQAIAERAKREAELVQALLEQIRGVTRAPQDPRYMGLKRAAKTMRNLNFVRLLGSVMLSSVPDVGRIVMEEGLARTMGTVFGDMGRGFRAIRLAKREAQAAGTALDMVLSSRARSMMDLDARFAQETRFERGVDSLAQAFGNITLLNPWNTSLKSITSVLVSTRILTVSKRLAEGKKISARDTRKLAQAGISRDMAIRIARQEEHWQREGGSIIAGADAWTDQEAREAFRDALLRDVDNTIITPGKGDAPLWTSTEWGKTVFQFKRFAAASTQRILLSGLQQREMATLNGVLMMTGLGALGVVMRDFTSDGEVRERTPEKWVLDAVDRSGTVSLFMEMDAIIGKLTGVNLQRLAAGEEASRFQARGLAGQLAGPTAGLIDDVQSAVSGAIEGDFTQTDLHRLRRLAPMQNHFALRYMLDSLEEGAAKEFGLPERRQQ